MSAEKSFEKYSSLAKEAMSAGDKTLSENYLQHADHFMRIIEDRNRNRNATKENIVNKPTEENKSISEVNKANDTEEIKNKD
jgi:ribulose bisphosphate carboxylase small subunit